MNAKHSLVLLAIAFVYAALATSCGADHTNEKDAIPGSESNIVETGELVSVNSRALTLPRFGRHWWDMKVIGLLDQGSVVEEGDSIIQLDPTDVKRFIIDRESNLETETASLEKLLVNNDNRINDLEASIKSASASFELKKLELEASRFESERQRTIKQLEFRQAEISFENAKKKLEYAKIILANDEKIQRIRLERIQRDIAEAYNVVDRLTIRAPISGVFQIAYNRRARSLLKIGDEVSVGNTMANIPQLTWMKVTTFVNEIDFMKLKEGQPVIVRLDAMPTITFNGEISYIGKLCKPREFDSRQKVFDVEVRMLDSDERLKPGMTVSCEFVIN